MADDGTLPVPGNYPDPLKNDVDSHPFDWSLGDGQVVPVPLAPVSVTATPGIAGHATVGWLVPTDPDGSPVTLFTVTGTSSDGGALVSQSTAEPTATSLNVAGLTSAKHYTFTVKTSNVAGQSAASTASASILIV